MFKRKLRINPLPFQLAVMLMCWGLFYIIGSVAVIGYFHFSFGISLDRLAAESNNHPIGMFISQAIFQIFTFLVPALIYAYWASPEPGAYLGMKKPAKGIQVFLAIFIGISLIFFVAPLGTWLKELNLGEASKELDEHREKFIKAYLSSSNTLATIRNIILIAVVPAFCEEFFFRGLVMKFAHSFVPKWWFSIGVSSLAFAAFHSSISEFVPIFIAGIILGWVYYLTSSIWLSVLLHLIVNAIQALMNIYSNPVLEKSLSDNTTVITLFCIATSLIIIELFFLFKNKTTLPRNWSTYVAEENEAGV